MRKILLILLLSICISSSAQNQAYYIGSSGGDLVRVDLDSLSITNYISFQDTISKQSYTNYENILSKRLDSEKLFKYYHENKDSLEENPTQYSILPVHTIIADSISFDGKYYEILIFHSDDHYIGGRTNQVNISIVVENLGLIYSYSDPMLNHTNIMICHSDSIKQKMLTQVYKLFSDKQFFYIEENRLSKIISLTEEYNFYNIADELIRKWLEPKKHLKLVRIKTEIINGHIKYSAIIKNVSDKRYCFYESSYLGPVSVEKMRNDKMVKMPLDAASSGIQYTYFKRIDNMTFLDPQQEVVFSVIPNKRESCGDCSNIIYRGCQIYRYGLDFYQWIFNNEVEFKDNYYSIYNLKEID